MKYILSNAAISLVDNGNGLIEIASPARTDYFSDICSSYALLNAPFYHTGAEGDFIFRCKVKPEFSQTYDAGGIIAYESEQKWIKFAFEKTDLGYTSVVAVITHNVSDDCNGERVDCGEIWMQIVRRGNNWCVHYSNDATNWKMVRYFRFELINAIKVGIFSQSPAGNGCRIEFSEVKLLENTYSNIRKAE